MLVVRTLLGRMLGLLVRLWAWTWRTQLALDPAARLHGDRPTVFAFWHGAQMPLVAAPRERPTAVMVSHSRDGALQTGVLRALGLWVVRGSASRGGAEGLRRLLRALAVGVDAAFAVDGPRGPVQRAKAGAARAAVLRGARLLPVGAASSRSWVVAGSWDRFEIPLPFARVSVHVGAPVDPARARSHPRLLDQAIGRATERALAGLQSSA